MFGEKAAPAYGADGETPKRFRNGSDSKTSGKSLAAIFVRHEETDASGLRGKPELVRGQTDFPLNAAGRKGAVEAGRTIARHGGVSKVYHALLSRGTDTANPIAEATGAERIETKTLMPWDKGDAEGKPVKTEDPKLRRFALDKPETPPPGSSEGFSTFAKRTDNAARSVVATGKRMVRSGKSPVAAISHSVDMRRLPHAIEGKPAGDPLSGGVKPGQMMGVTMDSKVVKVKPGLWGSR